MIIQSCAFTIHFPHNTKIREHLFELEKHFTDFQKPFTLVPLPPDAPMEIPRIVAATEHGHSQLTICGNSAQLVTNFDAKFNRDIKRCVEYVSDKCNRIVSALSIMDGSGSETPKFYFSGLSMTLLFDHEDGIVDSVDYVSKNFIDYKTNLPTDEVQFRLALVIERKYYVNVMVQNSRSAFYLPDRILKDDYVDFELINSMSRETFLRLYQEQKVKRIASLTMVGYYMFICKLTVFFMRPEDVEVNSDRYVPA